MGRPESLKKAQLVTREVQMASAFAHRLFTRGHVKYVRFLHGDRAADRDAGRGVPRRRDDGGREGSKFHSRLSLALRLDAPVSVRTPLSLC